VAAVRTGYALGFVERGTCHRWLASRERAFFMRSANLPSQFARLHRAYVPAFLVVLAAGPAGLASAATLPSGFTETGLTGTLSNPTAMTMAPDGRLFVCLQGGSLRVVKNGALLTTPFLTLSVNSSGERGLLGVAIDPDFATNSFIYVYYTTSTSPVHNRISRFTANGDVAVPGSGVVIMDLETLSSATNHNGGAIHFGPDGKLYVAVGENANAPNSQTLANRLGKILRLNPDGSIPTDNPFFNVATGVNRSIWALGLRNPFTFTFQRGSGRMFINDVGQSTWEEIDEGIAGANYGWPTTEGPTTDPDFVSPPFSYPHSGGSITGCAITGGAFYNPVTATFPSAYVGKYFFVDFCSGWIKRFDPASGAVADFASGIVSPVDLLVSNAGDLYYLARNAGLFRVRYTANQTPAITSHPQNRTVTEGGSAPFTVAASGTAPLSYQWQRGGVNIAGATSATYTLAPAQLSDDGAQFRAVVRNSFGTATSNAATLTVTANQPPTATISQPAAGALYTAGQVVTFAGDGTDPEDGSLPASAFTWRVDFHHDTHVHPFVPDTPGIKTGTFTIPTSGETSSNVWYRIHLTVKDSFGLTKEVVRDLLPRKANVTLATAPAGLQLKLDGTPVSAPVTFTGVAGIVRSLGATSPQTVSGTTWVFASWSDGGAATHTISTPLANTTYTATFAKARARITSPTPGSVLPGAVASFAWTAGTGVSAYQLDVGTSPAGTQVFASGPVTSHSATVTGLPMNGGTVYVRLWSSIGGNWEYDDYTYVAAPPPQTVTLVLAAASGSVGEAAGTASVTVRLTTSDGKPTSGAVTVHYATANGSATAGSDYTAASGTVSFAAGSASGATRAVTVPILNDSGAESGETFTVSLSSPSGAVLGTPATETLSIVDNDAATPSLGVSTTTATPGQTITVTVANGPGHTTDWVGLYATAAADTVNLDWKYLNGTRTAPATALTAASLSFTMPTTPGTYNFRLFASGGYTKLATSTTVTVQAPATPSLSINNVSVAEGSAGSTNAVFTVTLSAASSKTVTVNFATANGTATAGSDYVALAGTLTFPAGTTSRTINIQVTGDTVSEANETFYVNLSNAVNATIADGQGVGTITNDDTGSGPTLTASTATATPGQTITATVANGPGNRLDWVGLYDVAALDQYFIDWKYLSGTRTAPTTGLKSATLSFVMPAKAGVYNLRFFANSGYTRLATSANIVINTALSISNVTVTEGNTAPKAATFTVTLSVPSSRPVTVKYATANGTAAAGSDYVAKSGALTFNVNITSLTIPVTVNGDTTVEPNETFYVNLSSPVNASIVKGQGVGTITNDDGTGAASLSVNDTTASPGQTVTVTVVPRQNPVARVALHRITLIGGGFQR
jgi:glucose/arabinose dehydrogenase